MTVGYGVRRDDRVCVWWSHDGGTARFIVLEASRPSWL